MPGVLVDHRAGAVTDRTPAQVAADNALEDAIAAGIKAYDLVDEGSIVTTWAVLGASQGADDGEATYFQLYPSGVQPVHVTVGLMRVTERHLLARER